MNYYHLIYGCRKSKVRKLQWPTNGKGKNKNIWGLKHLSLVHALPLPRSRSKKKSVKFVFMLHDVCDELPSFMYVICCWTNFRTKKILTLSCNIKQSCWLTCRRSGHVQVASGNVYLKLKKLRSVDTLPRLALPYTPRSLYIHLFYVFAHGRLSSPVLLSSLLSFTFYPSL
jgi:hypothetical protein